MPFCNARRLASANSMPYCVRWGPDLHPPAPRKGQFRWGRSGPLWSVGITHDNAVDHGDRMTWLIPFKLGTILQLEHLQRWAWPDNVIRPIPLVLADRLSLIVTNLPNAYAHNQPQVFNFFNSISRLLIDRLDLCKNRLDSIDLID